MESTPRSRPPELDHTAKALLAQGIEKLKDAQELLWASDDYALLVVFQAMDAAGKDSTIEHVMSGVNPQGVHVVSFKKPSSEELDHTFLWRISKAAPERGRIGIFNRSQYEEVLALRVHPEWLDKQQLPAGDRGPEFWAARYDDLNAFERHLDRNGTKVVKFFLHVSKAEQKRRFMARLDNPDKQWKFKRCRCGSAGPLGRVHAGVRRRHHGDVDRVGAVVRHPCRSQARDAGDDRGDPRRHHRRPRLVVADGLGCRPCSQRGGPCGVGSRARVISVRPESPAIRLEKRLMIFAEFGTGQVFWSMLWFFLFFIWIWMLIVMFGDIFRSQDLSGWGKALWTIFVIFLPYLGVFVYLIARGKKMQQHTIEAAQAQDAALRQYVQQVAPPGGAGAADEIARLAALRDQGVLSETEFQQAKTKALS